MPELIKIASASAIAPGKALAVEVGNRTIAIFNVDGNFHALDDMCPHAGASLALGDFDSEKVRCPFHAADFNLKTGAPMCPPARKGVRSYPLIRQEDSLFIEV